MYCKRVVAMARMGEKAENVKSFISQINNLSSAMEKNKMNSHKTLKNPAQSGRGSGFDPQ